MLRTVYLARHGETVWNREARWQGHTDIPLNDEGRAQARALAERVRGLGVSQVSASDLSRARETAEIVAGRLGLPAVTVDAGLRERSFGCFEGLTADECLARFPELWTRYRADPRIVPPGGEGPEPVSERMAAAVARIAAGLAGPDQAALLVSHGSAIRALVATITGVLPPPMANGALFRVVLEGERLAEAHPLPPAA